MGLFDRLKVYRREETSILPPRIFPPLLLRSPYKADVFVTITVVGEALASLQRVLTSLALIPCYTMPPTLPPLTRGPTIASSCCHHRSDPSEKKQRNGRHFGNNEDMKGCFGSEHDPNRTGQVWLYEFKFNGMSLLEFRRVKSGAIDLDLEPLNWNKMGWVKVVGLILINYLICLSLCCWVSYLFYLIDIKLLGPVLLGRLFVLFNRD